MNRVLQKYLGYFSYKKYWNKGFMTEADFKQKQWHDGQMRDRVEYALLKSEWGK